MLTTLEKIIKWAFENGITISVRPYKEPGLKDEVEIILTKNGKSTIFRIYNWDDLGNAGVMAKVERKAFDLCLTRLVLI